MMVFQLHSLWLCVWRLVKFKGRPAAQVLVQWSSNCFAEDATGGVDLLPKCWFSGQIPLQRMPLGSIFMSSWPSFHSLSLEDEEDENKTNGENAEDEDDNEDDKDAFAALLRRISTIRKTNGPNYVVLRDK
ncbi:hypothetical protein RHMOL_Rhmol02G0112800 [Rhododendron molle]|uniref:Uncharacterized protein n=1 Tax=Rhododendron molle TaxID=49168 RepID=A0ACC0PNZ7_RHOML|nr:hypothetical protein RHMOL_Rhmol02G0112800 [Rhododendron molle]